MPTHESRTKLRIEYFSNEPIKKNKTNLILWLFEKKNLREKKTTANMANKGEDSNTTPTDDNISLNEVKHIWFIFIKMK